MSRLALSTVLALGFLAVTAPQAQVADDATDAPILSDLMLHFLKRLQSRDGPVSTSMESREVDRLRWAATPTAGSIDDAQRPGLPKLQIVRELQTPGPVSSLLWSSNGAKLAASSLFAGADIPGIPGAPAMHIPSPFGSLITIWNADGQVFRKLERPKPFFQTLDAFAFVGGDKQIVAPPSMQSNTLAFSVFDIDTGEIVHEVAGSYPDKPRNVNAATVVVASPDQSLVAVTFGRALAQPVGLYSTRDWSKLAELDNPQNAAQRPNVLAFSYDGKFLAVGRGDRIALIYDLSRRQVVQRIDAFPDRFGGASSIAFSPDGTMIAVGSGSLAYSNRLPDGSTEIVPPKDLVRVFSTKDGSRVATYPEPFYPAYGVTWSPDGRFLAFITGYRKLHLWDPSSLRELAIDLTGGPNSLALRFSPDGKQLAVGIGSNVRIYNVTP